jgi:hypothetical protein
MLKNAFSSKGEYCMDIRRLLERIIDTRGLTDSQLAKLWIEWNRKQVIKHG